MYSFYVFNVIMKCFWIVYQTKIWARNVNKIKKHPLPQNKTPPKQANKHTKQNKKLNKWISVSLILHFYICTVRNDTPGECEVKPKEIVTSAVSLWRVVLKLEYIIHHINVNLSGEYTTLTLKKHICYRYVSVTDIYPLHVFIRNLSLIKL